MSSLRRISIATATIVGIGACGMLIWRVREGIAMRAEANNARFAVDLSYQAVMLFRDSGELGQVLGEECEFLSWRNVGLMMIYGGGSEPAKWWPDRSVSWNQPPNSEYPYDPPPMFCQPASTDTFIMAVIGEDSSLAALNKDEGDTSLPNDAIVIVQVKDSGVHWQEPGDLRTDGSCTHPTATPRIGGSSYAFHVAFLDGEIWRLRAETPTHLLLNFFTVQGAKQFDRETILADYRID